MEGNHLKKIGDRIKYARYSVLGLSRRVFSENNGISPGSLQGWESNRYRSLSPKVINKLLDAFESEGLLCPKEWLVNGVGQVPAKVKKQKIIKSNYNFPLLLSEKDKIEIIQQAEFNKKQLQLNISLFKACEDGDAIKVEELINKGANVYKLSSLDLHVYNREENSPLHIAAKAQQLSIIKLLIQAGNKVDARNRKKETPLHWACYSSTLPVIDWLVKNGADINTPEQDSGTPFAWACYMGREIKIINYLYEQGAIIDAKGFRNDTPLYWACYNGHKHVVEYLIKKKANLSVCNSEGETIIDAAIKNGHTEIVKLLLSYTDG